MYPLFNNRILIIVGWSGNDEAEIVKYYFGHHHGFIKHNLQKNMKFSKILTLALANAKKLRDLSEGEIY